MPKQDSPCMFCGKLPCECDGVKKPKAKRAAKPKSVQTVKVSEDIFGAIPEPDKPKFKHKERDLAEEAVLRLLRPLVVPADQKQIDESLHRAYHGDLRRRITEWKNRHG